MEPVQDPAALLAPPNSPLYTLLTNFFDPTHTLQSIAASLGLTLEGLVNYIAIPEVADALDCAEAIHHHNAALRAAAALESVRIQLQSLPPRPSISARADTDRSHRAPAAARREPDSHRSALSPRRSTRAKPARISPAHCDDAARQPMRRPVPPVTIERGPLIESPLAAYAHPAISLEPPTLAATIPARSPARAMVRRQGASLQARELFGPLYKYKQAA